MSTFEGVILRVASADNNFFYDALKMTLPLHGKIAGGAVAEQHCIVWLLLQCAAVVAQSCCEVFKCKGVIPCIHQLVCYIQLKLRPHQCLQQQKWERTVQ